MKPNRKQHEGRKAKTRSSYRATHNDSILLRYGMDYGIAILEIPQDVTLVWRGMLT